MDGWTDGQMDGRTDGMWVSHTQAGWPTLPASTPTPANTHSQSPTGQFACL